MMIWTILEGRVEGLEEFLEGQTNENVAIEGEVTIESLVDQIKEEKSTAEEMEEATEEIPRSHTNSHGDDSYAQAGREVL